MLHSIGVRKSESMWKGEIEVVTSTSSTDNAANLPLSPPCHVREREREREAARVWWTFTTVGVGVAAAGVASVSRGWRRGEG